jgi:colicin import membrane protein
MSDQKAAADAAKKAEAKAAADEAKKAEAKAAAAAAEAAKEAKGRKAKADAAVHPEADFRRGLAAILPGSRPFGSVPASRMRLEDALGRALAAVVHVQEARAILDELKAELVTGGGGKTGAEAILGDSLGAFEALIAEAEEAFQDLRCD